MTWTYNLGAVSLIISLHLSQGLGPIARLVGKTVLVLWAMRILGPWQQVGVVLRPVLLALDGHWVRKRIRVKQKV